MWPDDEDYIAEIDGVWSIDDAWEEWMRLQELRTLNEQRAQTKDDSGQRE